MKKSNPDKGVVKLEDRSDPEKSIKLEQEEELGLQYWSLDPDKNANSDPNINWKEGQMPSTVNNSARMMMARLKENNNIIANKLGNLDPVKPDYPFSGTLRAKKRNYNGGISSGYYKGPILHFDITVPSLEYLKTSNQIYFEVYDEDLPHPSDDETVIPILEAYCYIHIGDEKASSRTPFIFKMRIGVSYLSSPYGFVLGYNYAGSQLSAYDYKFFSGKLLSYVANIDGDKVKSIELIDMYSQDKSLTSNYYHYFDTETKTYSRMSYYWLNENQIYVSLIGNFGQRSRLTNIALPFVYDTEKAKDWEVFSFRPMWIQQESYHSYSCLATSQGTSFYDNRLDVWPKEITGQVNDSMFFNLEFTVNLYAVREMQKNDELIRYYARCMPSNIFQPQTFNPDAAPPGKRKYLSARDSSPQDVDLSHLITISEEDYYKGILNNGK